VTTATAPGLIGEELELVALADGRALPPEAAPLVAAVPLQPPFRGRAVRRADGRWAVAASRIEVAELDAVGDAVERLEGRELLRYRRLEGRLWEVERFRL
jgi:hypothetical protein